MVEKKTAAYQDAKRSFIKELFGTSTASRDEIIVTWNGHQYLYTHIVLGCTITEIIFFAKISFFTIKKEPLSYWVIMDKYWD